MVNWNGVCARIFMIKSELIHILSEKLTFLSNQEVEEAVNLMFEQMIKSLEQGDRIEIRGFGSFSVQQRPPRPGHNPKTGEKLMIPAKLMPHFKPGKEFKARVNSIL
jgi:integration host factor subunit beta